MFPEAYKADSNAHKKGDNKLGSYSSASVPLLNGNTLTIVNAYTQDGYSRKHKMVSEQAIEEVFMAIKKDFPGKKIAYPAIGAGLAGGDWQVIKPIIDKCLNGENHTFVEYGK